MAHTIPINEEMQITNNPTKAIIFGGKYPNDPEEIMRLEKGTFYWKGEPIEDKYQIYERFNEWLKLAEQKQ